jgi:hypothetical protein
VTIHDLIPEAPEILRELSAEYLRVAELATTADPRSQRSACLLLAMRAASILHGIKQVLSPETTGSGDQCKLLL